MKLLMCTGCGDIFNLRRRLKTCSCGQVVGRYINDLEAEVNGGGVALAIGNGSLHKAVVESTWMKIDPRKELPTPWDRHPGSIICWARPHEGPANPHTKVAKNLKGGEHE